MAKKIIKRGAADVTVYVMVYDSTSTTGGRKTGLAYNTASLTAYYVRDLGSATAIALATQTVTGAHADGGFVEVSSANMPGLYRLDLPDAVCAAGASGAIVTLRGATGMVQVDLEIELVNYDPADGTRMGLTALPNATPAGAGGLPTVDAANKVVGLQAGGIAAATFAAGAIDADALAADAGTELATAIWAAAVRTLTAATNVTSTGAAVPITAGGLVSADVTAISTDATAANNAESFFDGTGYAGTNNVIPTVTTVNGLAADSISASALSAAAVDEILDEVVEGSLTFRQVLRILLAALAGKAAGGGTTAVTFRDVADAKNRISATVDANGNRSAVTLDGA